MAKSSSRKNAKRSRSPKKEVQERSITLFENITSVIFSKHQISFLDSVDDLYRNNNPITTTPTIAFTDPSSDTSTVLIDYSHSRNEEDLDALRSLFLNTNKGTQFTLSDASWQSPLDVNYETADLSGTYEFISYENNVIIAKAVSVTSTSSVHTTYDAKYFIDVPQITKNISNTNENISVIQNILGHNSNKSFSTSLGLSEHFIKSNELWITVGGSVKNTGKLKLVHYKIDEEGKEILYVENDITEENFTSSTDGILQINLYKKEGVTLVRDTTPKRIKIESASSSRQTSTHEEETHSNNTSDPELQDPTIEGMHRAGTNEIPTSSIGSLQSWYDTSEDYRLNVDQFSKNLPTILGRKKNKIEKTFNISVQRINGKNKYLVNGKEQKRLLLEKGKTYVFKQIHSSNEGHPLRISKVHDGIHNKEGTVVFGGVRSKGTVGKTALTTFTVGVLHDELYVFCQNHPGMGFALQIKDPNNRSINTTSPRIRSSRDTTPIPSQETTTPAQPSMDTSTPMRSTTTSTPMRSTTTRTTSTTTRTSSGGGGGGYGY